MCIFLINVVFYEKVNNFQTFWCILLINVVFYEKVNNFQTFWYNLLKNAEFLLNFFIAAGIYLPRSLPKLTPYHVNELSLPKFIQRWTVTSNSLGPSIGNRGDCSDPGWSKVWFFQNDLFQFWPLKGIFEVSLSLSVRWTFTIWSVFRHQKYN